MPDSFLLLHSHKVPALWPEPFSLPLPHFLTLSQTKRRFLRIVFLVTQLRTHFVVSFDDTSPYSPFSDSNIQMSNLHKNIAPLLPDRPSHLIIGLFHAYPFCFYRSLSLSFVCPNEQSPSVLTGRGLLVTSVLYSPVHYPADFRIKSVGILHTTRIPTA